MCHASYILAHIYHASYDLACTKVHASYVLACVVIPTYMSHPQFCWLHFDAADRQRNYCHRLYGQHEEPNPGHLREAWLAIPEAQRKERLEPLLAHQTNPDKLITVAAEKGLRQEQLPAMQGTRTDCWSDATRGARMQLNAQASNAGGCDGGYARIRDYPSCDTGEFHS